MGRIVEVIPKNKQQLISIRGFGEVKFEKYGEVMPLCSTKNDFDDMEMLESREKKLLYVGMTRAT